MAIRIGNILTFAMFLHGNEIDQRLGAALRAKVRVCIAHVEPLPIHRAERDAKQLGIDSGKLRNVCCNLEQI